MVLSLRTLSLAALLLTLPGAEAINSWRGLGPNTGCLTGKTHVSSSPRPDVSVHSGVTSLDRCKDLCWSDTSCKGIEYIRASQQCSVVTAPIRYTFISTGVECHAFTEDPRTSVYVMLPLGVVSDDGALADVEGLLGHFHHMKDAGIDGFMVDAWWGITEPTPKAYNFRPYRELVNIATRLAWKVQFVSSFHSCGGNVGDDCNIPLPGFVHELEGIWYLDSDGNVDREYISLFADEVIVDGERTPVQMYKDWFDAFAAEFEAELGGTVVEVMVGMGPCGELRYPSYRLSEWNFCGIGEFQCYDQHALSNLRAAAVDAGHEDWSAPPSSSVTGTYNSRPAETEFFVDGYKSEQGKFFLDWYSSSLKAHGHRILSKAQEVFDGRVHLSGKVAGIHWWYGSTSHAAELTAGYYNTNSRNAYSEIAEVFAAYNTALDFTCLEMRNTEQPAECMSDPEGLVRQAMDAAHEQNIDFAGENALQRYDNWAYDRMLMYKDGLAQITYLRLSPHLVETDNLARFTRFVTLMHDDSARRLSGQDGPQDANPHSELRLEFVV